MVRQSSEDLESLSQITDIILNPLLEKYTKVPIDLFRVWEEIVGSLLAQVTRPEKIIWKQRNKHEHVQAFSATLVIACESSAALHVQHQTAEIIHRVNVFLGYAAIGRIRLQQKPIFSKNGFPKKLREQNKQKDLMFSISNSMLLGIEDDNLRNALQELSLLIKSCSL